MAFLRMLTILFLFITAGLTSAQTGLLLSDPLTDGKTLGVRDNGPGQFVNGGWLVTGASDNIRYTPARPIEKGALEFDISGLRFNDTREQNHRGQIISMYDASFGDPRRVYAPDVRLNPFKFVLQRNGRDAEAYFANYMKFIMNTDGVNQFEGYSAIGAYPWDEARTYRMRLEWGDGIIRFFIDGRDIDRWPFVYRDAYRPAIHDIRIGTNTRNNAIVGAVYSNVKLYDLSTPPGAPIVGQPSAATTSLSPIIDWVGARHNRFEVRVNSTEDPNAGTVWTTGPINGTQNFAVSGALSDQTRYFAHVRLANAAGWGPWSAPHAFRTGAGSLPVVDTYAEFELALRSTRRYANPYLDVRLDVTFEGPTSVIRVNGFWDGGQIYKARMLPTEPGAWSFRVSSNDPELNGRAGSFRAESSANRGYVRVSPENPYTFSWAGNAEPFYLLGDTIWHMFYNLHLGDGSFQSIINARSTQRFNYAHGVLHDFLANEAGPVYRAQDHAREMFDTDTLNPDYFRVVDEKIDYMNERGMVAGLFFSWGNEGYQEYERSEQYERYMRYLVSRFASKNVFWILVGEFEEAGEPRSRWRDYMRVVDNADPYDHPLSLHPTGTTDVFGADPEHSFISHQRKGTPEELRALIARSRIFDKPVLNLEYGYEGNPNVFRTNQSAAELRRDHYALSLAGGYGVYGNHTPWYSTYHRVGDFVLTATDTPGAQYLEILARFFEQTQFHRLEPSQSVVNRGIAASWPGNEYVVQLPTGGGVSVDLSSTSGAFSADWFDPRTGERTRIGTVPGGSTAGFTAPSTDDWLLHLYNFPLGGSDSATIDLGTNNEEFGLSLVEPPDGRTAPAVVAGVDARTSADPRSDFYFYFSVSDAFAFAGSRPQMDWTVTYFDEGTGTLNLQYDAIGSQAYKSAGSITLANSMQWKTHTFSVTDAFFGNRQNNGSDFRIFTGVNNRATLDLVTLAVGGVAGPLPGPATAPIPENQSQAVDLNAMVRWTAGASAESHDVYFGTANPPPFRLRQSETEFAPGPLAPGTTYFWRIDEVNTNGVTQGPIWAFTTQSLTLRSRLNVLPVNGLSIDGNPDDWNLSDFQTPIVAGKPGVGDSSLVGYDQSGLNVSGYATNLSLPSDATDHTARVYARHDSDSLYVLIRVDDDDLQASFGRETNWANDCVEIYIDPTGDRGMDPLNGASSSSDIQLVVDVANQSNVYMTTEGYRRAILDGLVSAVRTDNTGYWVEIQLLKASLSPRLEPSFGIDFNFRDNDGDNAPQATTVYTWSDFERSSRFPSKIPERWSDAELQPLGSQTPPGTAREPMPNDAAAGVGISTTLSWSGGVGASSFDVHFGTANQPPLLTNALGRSVDPGPLSFDTLYFWRVDAVNQQGTTTGPLWQFTTGAETLHPTLRLHRTPGIVIDGDLSDWDLDEFPEIVRAGDVTEGDIALTGYDEGSLYWSGRYTGGSLPSDEKDHSARVYGRHDDDRIYFLVWLVDDEVRVDHGAATNWANDGFEIYFDPSNDGGLLPIDNSSSDLQLVVDAANQINVYMTDDIYRSRLLAGIRSSVGRHAFGWWCEIEIDKDALRPGVRGATGFGVDFNFRDNDRRNDPNHSTVYSWSDTEQSGTFPSKIPIRWGRIRVMEP